MSHLHWHRGTLEEKDARLAILAVGDDDQNIYTFRGANVQFIRRFQDDYSKDVTYLVENYRSSKNIIAASNALIKSNRDRMKGQHPICINRARQLNLPGGRWEHLDPVSKGRVQTVSVRDVFHQAVYVKREIDRLKKLDPKTDWQDIAILSRTKAPLAAIRAELEAAGYPIKVTLETGLPLHRVREFRMAAGWLEEREKENARASDLKDGVIAMRDGGGPNIWWNMVDLFFDHYRDTTGDSLLPVTRAIEHMYEFLAEQRRDKVIGQGIFLSTIHSAKGMEFPHVFILDGDWSTPMRPSEWEEERRVLYVGMTRAEETLRVLKIPSRPNPFLKEIRGDFVIPLIYRGAADVGEQGKRRYEVLGLDQLYLDFAGRYAKSNAIHQNLTKLQAGDSVAFCQNHSKLEIHDTEGGCVACLSNEGANKWKERIDRIIDIRVLAVLQRTRDDSDDGFQQWTNVDEWELPVLEVIERIACVH